MKGGICLPGAVVKMGRNNKISGPYCFIFRYGPFKMGLKPNIVALQTIKIA